MWFKTCAQYCMLSEIWHCPLYLFPVFLLTTETLLCTNHLCPLPSLHPTLIPFFTTLSLFAAETLLWAKFRTSVIQYSSLHFPHLSPTIVHFNASSYSTVFPMSHIHLLCVLLTGSCSLWEYIERKYEGIKTAPKHSVYQRQTYQKNAIFQTANRERLLLRKDVRFHNNQQRNNTTSALIYDLSKHFPNELMGSVVSFEAHLRNSILFFKLYNIYRECHAKPVWLLCDWQVITIYAHSVQAFLVRLTS